MSLKLRQALVVLLMTAIFIPMSIAQTPGETDIVKAIPDNAYMVVHAVNNPEREAIEDLWNPVIKAVCDANIHKDIIDMLMGIMPPSDQAEFQQVLDTAIPLFEGVEWGAMVSKEFIYSSQMALPVADYLFIMRGDKDKVEQNITGLKAILDTISALAPEFLVLTEEKIHDMKAWKLDIKGSNPPFNVTMATKDDLIVASWGGTSLVTTVLDKLAGKSEAKSLVDTERYKKSISKLPKAEDVVTFVDIDGIFSPIREFVNVTLKAEAAQDPEGELVISIINKIMNMFDIMDYLGAVELTDKNQVFAHTAMYMKDGYEASPISKIFCNQKPVEKFERFVPKEALSMSVGATIDMMAMYNLILDIIKTDVPDGENMLLMWKGIQDQIGFHPDKDLFGLIGDTYTAVSLPQFKPNPMGGGDGVFLLAVTDEAAAKAQLERGINALDALVKQAQQMIMIKDVEIAGTTGFKSVTHPMMMAMLNPVFGVHDGHLIIGTCADAVKMCINTAKGEHPSIMENDRFMKEGLTSKENLYSISFTDKSKLGEELGQAIQMMSMMVSMASAGMAQEEPEMGKVMVGFGKILGRLGPIVSRIDFYSSSGSITTCDDGVTITSAVTTYVLKDNS